MLVLEKKGALTIAQIAHMAVEQFLSRGGSEVALSGAGKGFIIDDETKSWWAEKVEEGIGPLGKATNTVHAALETQTQLEQNDRLLAGAKSHFSDVSGLDYDDVVRILVEVTQVVVMPPLTSANNVEVAAMGMAHLIGRLPRAKHLDDVPRFPLVKAYREHPKLVKMIQFHADLMEHIGEDPESVPFNSFLLAWARSAYARLEIGHKIAASFCLTDVPDGFVEAPWEAWSLVVPDGLLGDVARVWSVGLEPMLALNREGRRRNLTRVESDMVKCLVRSSALALANPDEFKKRRDHGFVSRSAKGRHDGPPDLAQARYMISAPVEVDLRENVAAALEDERLGRKHASPKVQFLVRGHPRMQVHGEGRALRKKIWVQPFWKGPAEGRILLRPHRIDSGKEQ